jgi:hypothetical protein
MRDREILAASILGGAIIVAAIILALGMASLGARIEMAGQRAGNTPSLLHVRVSGEGPVEIRESSKGKAEAP